MKLGEEETKHDAGRAAAEAYQEATENGGEEWPEAIGTLGNANRRFFHGPGTNNWDLALYKNLRLTEAKSLQFRAEFFNAFNHAQFNAPQGNIKNGSFGFVTSAANPRIGQVAIKFLF